MGVRPARGRTEEHQRRRGRQYRALESIHFTVIVRLIVQETKRKGFKTDLWVWIKSQRIEKRGEIVE